MPSTGFGLESLWAKELGLRVQLAMRWERCGGRIIFFSSTQRWRDYKFGPKKINSGKKNAGIPQEYVNVVIVFDKCHVVLFLIIVVWWGPSVYIGLGNEKGRVVFFGESIILYFDVSVVVGILSAVG